MKNKVWSIALIIVSMLSNNIYAANKTIKAVPSETNVYITHEDGNKVLENLSVYIIDGYSYVKLRDIGYLMDYNVIWEGSSNEIYVSKGNKSVKITDNIIDDEVKFALLTNQVICTDNVRYENLSSYNIEGYTYFKLRDIAPVFEFYCEWDADTNTVTLDSMEDDIEASMDYSAIDGFADNYLKDTDDKQIIDGYDCTYRRNSKDYTNIENYIKKYIDNNFNIADYIITEDISTHIPYGFSKGISVLDIRLNVDGYVTKNFGYRIYIMNSSAKIITFIGEMNVGFNIKDFKAPSLSDEALFKKAIEKDNNKYVVTDKNIFRYFDMNDLQFKSDIEITYKDHSGCYFTTLNTFELN